MRLSSVAIDLMASYRTRGKLPLQPSDFIPPYLDCVTFPIFWGMYFDLFFIVWLIYTNKKKSPFILFGQVNHQKMVNNSN